MDNVEQIHVDVTGESGRVYKGDFTVKLSMTRSDRFRADQVRRQIIGPCPDGTPPLPALQTEAFTLGQLVVRVLKAPKWWEDSDNGLQLEDSNVIYYVYDKVLELDEKRNKKLSEEAGKALKKLTEKVEKSE